jgi:GT2 family glycosyltransferase/SAM-dependent methyltransferase
MTQPAPTGETQQEFYEDFWSRTEDQRILGPMGRHTRRLIRRMLEGLAFKSVLDVSCGEGTTMAELFHDRNDLRIVGTDLSKGALAMAAKKNPHAEFRELDLRNGPFPEKFDLVMCSEVIEHVEDDAGAIKCMAAMTGRYLLLTTLGGRMRDHEKDIGHLRNYDPEGLKQLVRDAGLTPVDMFQWGWPFFSPIYRDLLARGARQTRDLTTGEFGFGRRLLSRLIYAVFCLNAHYRGDELVLLAERPTPLPLLPKLQPEPMVSVVIPVRNEERFMGQCMASLKALDYPKDKVDVIFADGESTDKTVEMAKAAGFRVVPNPGLNVAAGRNAGFAAATGAVIAFTDADCLFDPMWVRAAVRHFVEDASIAGLAGPTRIPADQNAFGKAVGTVFGLAALLGATVHRGKVNHVHNTDDLPGCNSFYRRDALAMAMPTNTLLKTNEDVEMNAHIRRRGYRLVMTPDVIVSHYKRTTAGGLWKQMRAFASGRARLGRRDRTFLSAGHRIAGWGLPLAIVAVLLAGLFHPALYCLASVLGCVVFAALFVCVLFKDGPVVAMLALPAVVVGVTGWVYGFQHEQWFPTRERRAEANK